MKAIFTALAHDPLLLLHPMIEWTPFFISFKTATTVLCNSVTVSRPLPFQFIRHPNPACEAVGTAVNVFFVHRL